MTTLTSPADKLLLTSKEAARLLSCSERTLFALSHPQGPLPFVRIGTGTKHGGKRFAIDDLRRFIDEQRQS